MSSFSLKGPNFNGAYCTVDTFRHLLSNKQAVNHLRNVARYLKSGGIYILGIHLLPRTGIKDKIHRWKGSRGKLTVHSSITVLNVDPGKREETLGYSLRIDKQKYRSVYILRTYTIGQFRKLLSYADCFEIINVFDLDYNLSNTVRLDADTEEAVFLLRKK